MDKDDVLLLSSELYSEYDYESKSKPTVNQRNVVSKFPFKLPKCSLQDSDGDFIVRRKRSEDAECIEIEHSYSTSLDLVGHQVWRGSLLLADWILHNRKSFSKNEYILELGTGVGLTSTVASMFSPVLCTDIDRGDIFKIIKANIARNKSFTKYPVEVMELDFLADNLPDKIVKLLPKISTVIAADVIYDDHLTDAFVKTIQKLLAIPPKRTICVALEKRYVFTISDLNACAPCYEYFLETLDSLKNIIFEEIKIDFPQYFHYDRVKELVLFEIGSKV